MSLQANTGHRSAPPLSPLAMGVEQLSQCPACRGNALHKEVTPSRSIGKDVFGPVKAQLGLCRCGDCGLVFVNPRPARSLLDAFYSGDDYVCHGAQAGSSITANFLLEVARQHGPYPGRRFLDFGCGGGFLLAAAREAGWSATGFDVGERAVATCLAKGLSVVQDLKQLKRASFDVIFLNHVFEHIAEQQDVLWECHRLLATGGKLFIVVPNVAGLRARLSTALLSRYFDVDERHRAFPIHLFYFSPSTLTSTLQKAGFHVTAVETFGLGVEELFLSRQRNSARNVPRHPLPQPPSKRSRFRQIAKKAFFGAKLGENLLAVAQPL